MTDRLRKAIGASLAAVSLGLAGAAAGQNLPDDPNAVLEMADEHRMISRNAQLGVELRELGENGEEVVDVASYRVWTDESERSRVHILDGDDEGQRVLLTDDGLWLYAPQSRRTIRITPLQRLTGSASYGDIGRMVWSDNYEAQWLNEGPSEIDGTSVRWLRLEATESGATYASIDLAVATDNARPIQGDYYLEGRDLFKKAFFGEPQPMGDGEMITRIAFEDVRGGAGRTRMVINEAEEDERSDRYFTRSGLERD